MARRVANAGAFYAYIARGLGRPAGVGAAWVALIAYNALQVGLYGAIGAAAEPVLDQLFGGSPAWWVVALVAWALVAVLGLLRVDVNGLVLAVLLVAEIVVIVVFDLATAQQPGRRCGQLRHPVAGQPASCRESARSWCWPSSGFVGFESAVVFSEESKDPKRTVPLATYLSVGDHRRAVRASRPGR